ncbi:MAG: hypothetical protein U0R19_12855 [Bryobacteraceae bacterium]
MNPRPAFLFLLAVSFATAQHPTAHFAEEPQIVLTQSPTQPPPEPGTIPRGDTLSQLLGKQDLGFSAMLLALALAFGFGAMHAMSPGHGKTIVAAYLVGSRGTFKHALFLGAMVTFTHTVSVFLLGLGTLFLSRYVVPDKIYPILSALSGAMIIAIGAMLFYKRLHILAAHSHSDHHHVIGHHHHHDDDHTHVPEGEVTFSSLTTLAVSGGMVPCPSALVLLLSAIALGRIGFGLALLTSFSLGLALVLISIGGIVLFAKNLLPDTPRFANSPFFRMLPIFSAAAITLIGIIMTAAALGYIKLNVS